MVEQNFDNFKIIELSKLNKAKWNYKKDDDGIMETLINSIKEHGFIENIVVRKLGKEKYEVVNGNHRLDALEQMGYTKVMCADVGKISQAKAELMARSGNQITFDNDLVLESQSLKRMVDEFGVDEVAKVMMESAEEITERVNMLEFNWNQYDEDKSKDKENEFETISLKLPLDIAEGFKDQIERFKGLMNSEEKDLKKVSSVTAIQAMTQCLIQTPDSSIEV